MDDPIVAVLLLQEKNQSSAFIQLQDETKKLVDSISEMKKYREQILIELMNEAKRTSEQSEEKFIGLLSKYLSELECSHTQFHKQMLTNKIIFSVVGIIGIVFGVFLHSLF